MVVRVNKEAIVAIFHGDAAGRQNIDRAHVVIHMSSQCGQEVRTSGLGPVHGLTQFVKTGYLDHHMHYTQRMFSTEQGDRMLARVIGMHKVDFQATHARWIKYVSNASAEQLRIKRSSRLDIRGRQYHMPEAQVAGLLVTGDKKWDPGSDTSGV